MGIIASYRIQKYINVLVSSSNTNQSQVIQAIDQLKSIGSIAIPKLLEALDHQHIHVVVIELLTGLVRDETLSLYIRALASPSARIVSGVANILIASQSYNPNPLIDAYIDTKLSHTALTRILTAHKDRLSAQAIQNLLGRMDRENRTSILRLVEQIATEAIVPELLPWMQADDWVIRLSMARIFCCFRTPQGEAALIKLLEDPHKSIRQTALEGLAGLNNPETIGAICKLIRDSELTVQNKAIEIIIQMNTPKTVPYLLELLQDELEYVRRGAVEVLNAIADISAIKDLLQVLRDKDWWVKVRAADALGTIGGPMVIDAVLELIKDEDPFIRRTAIEILNTTSDERIFDTLIEAINDGDWWVRERAIDALAQLGDNRAVPVLLSLLGRDNDTNRVVIRALTTLGDPQALPSILHMIKDSDRGVVKEALQALGTLTREASAAEVQRAIVEVREDAHQSIIDLAGTTLQMLIQRFGNQINYEQITTSETSSNVIQSYQSRQNKVYKKGFLEENNQPRSSPVSRNLETNQPISIIDPEVIEPGQIFQGRYRFVRRVGKGAFGTALLVEDIAVKEQIVLKFLHAQLAATEQLVKRFVRELRYTRKITHENVIRIYDFLTFGHSYAISMEYFDSHALSAYLQSDVRIAHRTALKLIRSVCNGMRVAHQVQVIHRDLKPANILVNKEGMLKIVDFGLAAAMSHEDSRVTRSGAMVGTPAYMSPEQIRGEELDPRTDIYSLGIIMYELFTGQLPYLGRDAVSVIYQHIQGDAAPPREVNPNITSALEAVILKAMAVDKQHRFQSMDALRRALDQVEVL